MLQRTIRLQLKKLERGRGVCGGGGGETGWCRRREGSHHIFAVRLYSRDEASVSSCYVNALYTHVV